MKRIIGMVLAALALCLCLVIPAAAAADARSAGLKCGADGSFKIIQVTDTQDFLLSCALTQDFLYDLAKTEKPDLFVLTGDNATSGGDKYFPKFIAKPLVKAGVENLMRAFDRIYKDFGIPMTMVYGNHDNECGQALVSRAEQFAMYAAHKCFAGYYIPEADEGTQDQEGQHYGTHNLIVRNSAGTADAFNLWMFDSGSYNPEGGYSWVQTPQIKWFKETNEALGKLPSLAFQHIIVKEIEGQLTAEKKLPAGVKGELRESPCPGKGNDGQYDALCDGGVMALFVGHDHVNTYEFELPGTDLVNSPCTGFGSYGDIDLRGARVITLNQNKPNAYESKIVTFQAFYPQDTLHSARLGMYQSMSTAATLLDWLSFKPLLWLLGLFNRA
ncbi:MAG: metallophosphoesterase [Firmicutes bacterium]|nr:metallophosphoesterase [Bacillota bacterium]